MLTKEIIAKFVRAAAVLGLLSATGVRAEELNSLDFKGRSLVDLMELYRSEGFEIVYSSDLVKPDW